MNQAGHFDVIIIGTGAGGGTLAHKLAPSGLRILLLERGDFLPREKENWDPGSVFVEGKYDNAETWLDQAGKGFLPGQHYYVGGNTKFFGAVLMRMRSEDFGEFQKTIGVNDYYWGSEDWEYPLGHIQMLGKSNADMLKQTAPRLIPGRALKEITERSLDFWLTSEDLPSPDNRVTVNTDGQIVLRYTENNQEGHKRLTAKLRGMLNEIGCENRLLPCSVYMGKKIPLAGVAHQNGTLRFGVDPHTSVLDLNCKAHDLDNLYVVDSSFFVSSSAVNPSWTIIANALRVGDHLADCSHLA